MFSGLVNLETLDVSGNALTALPDGVFSGLVNLETLDVSGNALTALPDGVFSGLVNLETLDVSGNALTALPASVFNGLANLVTLDVADNALTALPEGLFEGLSSLMSVDFSGNDEAPFDLTAELVERPSPDLNSGFGVAITMAHGTPGPLKVILSATGALPTEALPSMGAGITESASIPFDWTGNGNATISIAEQGFTFYGISHAGLNFVAGEPLVVHASGSKGRDYLSNRFPS